MSKLDSRAHLKNEIRLHEKLSKEYKERYRYKFSIIFQDFWNRKIIDEISNSSSTNVLDFGCGNGILIKDLTQKFNFVVGLDVSFDMVKNIRSKFNRKIKIVVGDGLNLPFVPETFDAVVCRGSLHHLSSLPQALIEIRRCLKKNGILVFSEPSNDSLLVRMARNLMYKSSDKFNETDVAFRKKEIIKAVKDAQFSIENMQRFGFIAYTLSGFPDHLPVLKYIPFNVHLTKGLILIDRLCARLPLIKNLSLHLIAKAKKQ